LEKVAALVPPDAIRLVELGCSAGVFANVLKARRPALEVVGVDADAAKVATARKTIKGRPGITFVHADAATFLAAAEPVDVIAVVDMLYLLVPERQDELIAQAGSCLTAGGCLIIKEMGDRPRWKRSWCYVQEWLAVRVVGLTKGAGIYLRRGDDYVRAMTRAGLAVGTFDLGRGYLHPHYALRGVKVK